ncbi:palmitoyltransferase swf1 [Saxophila tyrrhenica]|uniref:Palmitoyltransferase n=1 Tax=Saxophila tyrrhenica TaxID=1690608 RepID=A0AAV9NVW4_9PEZI|nr:palmitoyltransferase swf1 [Saxophila tyrrhenica]
MGVLLKIALAVGVLSFITFVALFGQLPALRKTPIGWLQRVLCLHIPNGMRAIDRHTTGGRITIKSKRLGRYLFYEKNPIVLIIFLALMTGSAVLFLWNAIPELPTRLIVPIPFLVSQPYLFTWLCVRHNDHYITPSNHTDRLHDYPYDDALFSANNICSTCNLTKPARSKHCSLCGTCVAMCDHHCPWINNCVGRGNYRYFLALLLSLGVMDLYGAYLSYWLLQPWFKLHRGGGFFTQQYWDDTFQVMVIAINAGGLSIAGVGMLTIATAALPFGLLGYHCYLIWAGMTTNESQKWADLREDMADGFCFKGSREELRTHQRLRKYGHGSAGHANGGGNPALHAWSDETEVHIPWPVSSDQIVVRTMDGRPPRGQEALWRQVWSLNDVENLYDLGGWDNFAHMLKGN